MLNARDLPDDIETLKRLVIEREVKLAERDHQMRQAARVNQLVRHAR